MSTAPEELLNEVEAMKNMMMSRATGGGCSDDEYRNVRRRLIQHPLTKDRLPRFVKTCSTPDEFWPVIQGQSPTYRERREYIRKQFEPLVQFLEEQSRSPSDETAADVLGRIDAPHIRNAWEKALERRVTDPEAAITSARTLLETVCKHVIEEQGGKYEDGFDLPKLYRLAAESLNLSPSQHTEQVFRQILGGCQTVVEGLGSLRNRHGDAHGTGRKAVRPAARHAELAVNLAGTMATFLVATLDAKRPS